MKVKEKRSFMLILKYIDICLIIIVSSYIGFYKSKKFSNRVKNLKDFKSGLSVFKSKIEFTYEPIKDIFEEISKIIYQNNKNIFKDFCESINDEDVSITWNKTVENSNFDLKNEDKEVLRLLGKMLGKTDKTGQISQIDLVDNFLDKQILEAEEEKQKNEKLYKTLGVVCGLVIAIILV